MFAVLYLGLIVLVLVYLKINKSQQYWKAKNVRGPKPWPILGNLAPALFRKKSYFELIQEFYDQYANHRYFGIYQFAMPTLFIRDVDLIKRILVKDFDKFMDRTDNIPEKADPFWARSLGMAKGERWHDMRVLLSPAFTSSKMKMMFSLMAECADDFIQHFETHDGKTPLDMKDVFCRYANDVIASTAFGIKCDSLKDKDNEFFLNGKSSFDISGFKSLKFFGYAISSTLMQILKVTFIDARMRDFFISVVKDTIRTRDQNGTVRLDMIHLLREAQKGRLKHDKNEAALDVGFAVIQDYAVGQTSKKQVEVTDEDIAAHGVLFFFAGFDTVALLMCHLGYELAVNPDTQAKLAEEIDSTLKECDGKVTYEALLKMKYLDMVVTETLRLWPPAATINRSCTKRVTIEAKSSVEEDLIIEPGTDCAVPVYSIHRDPKYYPNPDKFDPERFNDSNKSNVNPYTYMPFGIGPRSCIGNRFALLEAKTLLFFILSKYQFVPVATTVIPFAICKKTLFILNSANGYWLGMHKRKLSS